MEVGQAIPAAPMNKALDLFSDARDKSRAVQFHSLEMVRAEASLEKQIVQTTSNHKMGRRVKQERPCSHLTRSRLFQSFAEPNRY